MRTNKSEVGCCLQGPFTIYGNREIPYSNEFKRFDEERPGRPADVVSVEIVKKVHNMILTDRRTKVGEVEEAVGVSYGTAINVLHDKLGMRKLSA